MSAILEESKLELVQCKEQRAPDNSDIILRIQSLFRTYHTCKWFCLIKVKPSFSLTELFTNFSLFKIHFMAYIHGTIIGYLEKCGMYFKLEAISEQSWNGSISTDFTHFYYGEVDEQKIPHGFGVLISFFSVYEGQFSNGKPDGQGRMVDSKYGAYDGDWQTGQKNGNGTIIYWNGSKYSGNWKNDQKHGHAILDEQDSHYEGNFENDLKHGYGERTFENENHFYKGNFVNGKFDGFGVLIKKESNEKYEGEFKSGVYHGKGTWLMRDGWTFIGDFVNGIRNGFGIIYNPILKYENQWKDGRPFGEFNFYSAEKYVLKGFWHNLEPRNHMDEVVKDLFLGNHLAATNKKWLREIGIKHIVRILNDENVELLPGITYFFVKAKDNEKQNILKYLPEAVEFITKSLKAHKKVLVHCYAGISRSPTVVIAFMMKEFGQSFDEAFQYLKSKRKCICPNIGFIKQLKMLKFKKKQTGLI